MAFLEVYWPKMKSRMNCALTDQFIGMKVNIIYWSIMSREFVQNSSGICIPDINKPKRINTVKSNKYSNVLCHTGKVPQLLAYLTCHNDVWCLKNPEYVEHTNLCYTCWKTIFNFKMSLCTTIPISWSRWYHQPIRGPRTLDQILKHSIIKTKTKSMRLVQTESRAIN